VLGAGCAVGAIVFGGIVAAIFIPNFLEALQKAKQKRTMADLRVWGAVLEDYRLEHDGEVPAAGTVEELAGVLGLDGADTPATTDAWQHPLRFACWSTAPEGGGCDTYRLVSAGRDGVFENEDPALYEPGTFRLVDFDADLVVQDGAFVRYPGPAR
jgi:general secretion pathway protein G